MAMQAVAEQTRPETDASINGEKLSEMGSLDDILPGFRCPVADLYQ